MQFPNAHSGVKKIFTAEILSLIGVVLFIAAAIAASEEKSFTGTPSAKGFAARRIRKSRKHVA